MSDVPPPQIDAATCRGRIASTGVAIGLATITLYNIVLPIFGKMLQEYFSISLEQYGVMLGIGALATAVGAPIGGYFEHRLGPRATMRWWLAGVALGMLLFAVARSWSWMLIAGGVVAGI